MEDDEVAVGEAERQMVTVRREDGGATGGRQPARSGERVGRERPQLHRRVVGGRRVQRQARVLGEGA